MSIRPLKINTEYRVKKLPNEDISDVEDSYIPENSYNMYYAGVTSTDESTSLYIYPETPEWQYQDVTPFRLPLFMPRYRWFANNPTVPWTALQNVSFNYLRYRAGTSTTGTTNEQFIDSVNWRRSYTITVVSGYSNGYRYAPLTVKMLNPNTMTYQFCTLHKIRERQRYADAAKTIQRENQYRTSYYWERPDGTRKYIFESNHWDLEWNGENDPYTIGGYWSDMGNGTYDKLYATADVGYDFLNDQLVGVLNLEILYPTIIKYIGPNEESETHNYQYLDITDEMLNGAPWTSGPFDDEDYYKAFGTENTKVISFYKRAILLDNQPGEEVITKIKDPQSLYKACLYGPM